MRIGLIGFGFIGAELYRRIAASDRRDEVVFIHSRSRERLAGLPEEVILDDLSAAPDRSPDLIVEMAGPEVSCQYGTAFLAFADYMPLSLTALADEALCDRLTDAAGRSGRSLLVPHGALVGLDSLVEWRDMWDEVSISFRKPPSSLGVTGAGAMQETILFDGSVRDIAARYPHNVNAMVACALATIGLDRCRARLISDPAIDCLELAVEARGRDGSHLSICRRQPARGVSGSEMAAAVHASVCRVGGRADAMAFV